MQLITLIITGLLNSRGCLLLDWQPKISTRKLFQENVIQTSHEGLSNPAEYPHVVKTFWPKNYYPDCTEDTLTRETHFSVFAPLAPGSCILTGLLINPLINFFMQFVIVCQYIFTLFYTTCLLWFFFFCRKKTKPKQLIEVHLKSSFYSSFLSALLSSTEYR